MALILVPILKKRQGRIQVMPGMQPGSRGTTNYLTHTELQRKRAELGAGSKMQPTKDKNEKKKKTTHTSHTTT